jgi:5-methylcytosine-specific restriction endonuclease McrA
VEFKLRLDARHFSKDELLADLREATHRAGKTTIGQREYLEHGKFSCKPFINRFGSWNKAIEAAGFVVTVDRNISDEMLFENLERVWITLGRQPSYGEMQKPLSQYAVKTYRNRFGGWIEACKAFIRFKKSDPEFAKILRKKTVANPRSINEKLRLRIFKRDNYACVICGKSPATHHGTILHIDHMIPVSKGGDNSAGNLRTLCDKCNLGRGNDQSV